MSSVASSRLSTSMAILPSEVSLLMVGFDDISENPVRQVLD